MMLSRVDTTISRAELDMEFRAHASDLRLDTEVFSSGPVNATVAFIGDGPGESEVRSRDKIPFVGGSGKLLWDAVSRYGFNRSNIYCTNVVKRQISLSAKGNERYAVYQDEMDKWIGLLHWELQQLPNLQIVFLLGNNALHAVLGLEGISHWRGSVLDLQLPNKRKGKAVCTFNPAYPMRELRMEVPFMQDCQKLDLVKRGVFKPHEVKAIINPTFDEAMAFISDLKKVDKPVSFDIESINKELACFGLGNDPHKAMCISLRDQIRNRYSLHEECDILNEIQSLCDSHAIIAQNGNFDAYNCRLKNWLDIEIWFDTLLAHHNLYPRLPHNLAFLVAQYTTHPFYKDEGKDWKEGDDVDMFWEYNCKDVALTYAVYEKELKELESQKVADFFFNHDMRVQKHLVQSTVHGVETDQTVKQMLVEQISEDVARVEGEFYRLVQEATGMEDYMPNPNSHQQMRKLFFEDLKLKGKGFSVDKNNRNNILKEPSTSAIAKEIIATQDKFKTEDKFLGTYANSRVSSDNRFRCEWKQTGVSNAPGRLSSAQLLIDGDGGNMQNQPNKARAMYIADEGCVFCYFDLSQAEARVVGWRANIHKWKEQFEQARKDGKFDCHRALASEMFRVPYDKVPLKDHDDDLNPTIRYIAKRCRHGLNYRMERWKLAEVTELPFYRASEAFMIYHKITPELMKWWAEEERRFKLNNKCVYNALGRRNKVLQKLDDTVLDSIIAFYPQSTIGDKVKRVWYKCHEDDAWPKHYAQIRINVHDNLVGVSAPDKYAKTCLSIMKKHAEEPIMIQDVWVKNKPEPLIIPAELKMSYPSSWDAKANKGKGMFVEDKKHGLHRWSNLKEVVL